MGIFNFFKTYDINQGVKDYLAVPSAILLDVRTVEEYNDGHIPQSINIPLQQIEEAESVITDKNTPIFVYCYSGNRSGRATAYLKRAEYTNVKNIGGIMSYKGNMEK